MSVENWKTELFNVIETQIRILSEDDLRVAIAVLCKMTARHYMLGRAVCPGCHEELLEEMSESVKNYPPINWKLPGMRPLQVSLVVSAIITTFAGIASNPLFTLTTNSVNSTPILRSAIITQELPHSDIQVSSAEDLINK